MRSEGQPWIKPSKKYRHSNQKNTSYPQLAIGLVAQHDLIPDQSAPTNQVVFRYNRQPGGVQTKQKKKSNETNSSMKKQITTVPSVWQTYPLSKEVLSSFLFVSSEETGVQHEREKHDATGPSHPQVTSKIS